MRLIRGKEIIQFNKDYAEKIRMELERFYAKSGIAFGETLKFDRWEHIKMVAEKFAVLAIFIPLKDEELGALLYHTKGISYMLINSAIPRANGNFAFCHEIYHAMNPGKMLLKHGLEMYLDMDYQDSEDEKMANAFAGCLLMPEEKVKEVFQVFQNKAGSLSEITAKVAEYFGAPFVSAVIRIFALELCNDTEELNRLLALEKEDIHELYEKYWLNTDYLNPPYTNQFSALRYLMETEAEKYVEKEWLSEKDSEYILKKMERLYQEIGRN